MAAKKRGGKASSPIRPELLLGLALAVVTLSVYLQVRDFEFCNYDDDAYVYNNPWVFNGLTAKGIAWAFTDIHEGNWHPLTWLSHMADSQLYGMNAGWHHLTSVLFHVLNTLLLFAAFRRMTGMRWQSFFLAAVFALHPLHVESVAWIAERKDVLSTFFMLLALNAYIRYVAAPCRTRYLPVLGFFICGLLSKPMVVTFPVLLLLLDYWPLQRLHSGMNGQKSARALLLEKAPLFACAAFSTIYAYIAQVKGGAVASLTDTPLQLRLANALVSYCLYLKDIIAPFGLAVFYPFPRGIPFVHAMAAGMLMLAITLWVLRHRSRQPWLAVGWLWYVVTLLPVIGIIKIGLQARADRYTYVPLAGVGIAAIWSGAYFLRRTRRSRALGMLGGAVLMIGLMALSYQQVRYWHTSITLFEHTLAVTNNNIIAHNNLAAALLQENRAAEAIDQCRLSLNLDPRCEKTYLNLGLALAQQGDWEQAVQNYRLALELQPDLDAAHNSLGIALARQGNTEEAIKQYTLAINNTPNYVEAHNNMGNALLAAQKPAEARDQYTIALRINPEYAQAYNGLGNAAALMQDFDEAAAQFQRAIRLSPENPTFHCNLGKVNLLRGMLPEAVSCFRTALQLNPAAEDVRGKLDEALQLQNAAQAH